MTNKRPVQIRLDRTIQQAAIREAERRNSDLSKYLTQLLLDDLYVSNTASSFVRRSTITELQVCADGRLRLVQNDKILLNQDTTQYQFNLRPDVAKIRELFKDKRQDDIRIVESIEVRTPQFSDSNLCAEANFPAGGGYRIIKFPKQVAGSEVEIAARVSLINYLRYRNPNSHEHIRDGYMILVDAPTDYLSVEVHLERALYAEDLATGRLKEQQIADALRVELGPIATSELKEIVEVASGRRDTTTLRKSVQDGFHLRFEAQRPIFGLGYRVTWVAPSAKTTGRRH